jgi:hypothetical protein
VSFNSQKTNSFMAILRTYIFAFLLIIFSAGNVFAQSVELQVDNIRREMKAIDADNSLKTVVIDNDEKFLKNLTDGGIMLTGRFKNDEIKKLEAWIGLSDGIQIRQYYFKNGKLIFVYKIFEKYVYDEIQEQLDYSKTTGKSGTRYFFHNGKLLEYTTFGETQYEQESFEKLTEEAIELQKILAKKNKVLKNF